MNKRDQQEVMAADTERLVDQVRRYYGQVAGAKSANGCCTSSPLSTCGISKTDLAARLGYEDEQLTGMPEHANLGLGCGAPLAHLGLQPGETALDLGSGGGLDALLAARVVGSTGQVIGVDMTTDMIRLAQANAEKAGLSQVEFREGRLEALPIEDASVDAVTSNCVINLVPDKATVFAEIARVLRPGGRLVIADIILDGALPDAIEHSLLAYLGCIAGALQRKHYFAMVTAAGLRDIHVLEDVDVVARLRGLLPEPVVASIQESGVRMSDIEGKIRSVTFGAVKPGVV
jgi:SAM-dependent methyltransferase